MAKQELITINKEYLKKELQQLEIEVRKKTAKEILQPIYELCKVRKEITFDDLNFLVIKYGTELE